MTIGDRLKEARKSRGFSQDSLAQNIGTSRGVITNIELNKIEEPQPLIVNAICNTLSINKEWLLYGTGEMAISTDVSKSAKILSEIFSTAQELSEEEQLYVLDMINTYKKHLSKEDWFPFRQRRNKFNVFLWSASKL